MEAQVRMAVAAEQANRIAWLQAILTGLAVAFTAWAAREAGRAAGAADHAAEAAEVSVAVAQETAKRQLRAYVLLEKADISKPEGYPGGLIQCTVRNFGQTPAKNVAVRLLSGFKPFPLPPDAFLNVPPPPAGGSRADLGPGACIYPAAKPNALDEAFIPGLIAGDVALYLLGTIEYVDAFGEPHTTRFRYFYREPDMDRGMIAHPEGNDHD